MLRNSMRVSGMIPRYPRIGLRFGTARGLALGELLVGDRLAAGADRFDRRDRVGVVERAVVALVDRDHRRDVARAEALEALDEELAVGGGRARVIGLVVIDP